MPRSASSGAALQRFISLPRAAPLGEREKNPELGNLAFTTVKSSTYRKNVGGNAPSPHALADDTLAPLAYVRLSSITDVLRHYAWFYTTLNITGSGQDS